MDKNVFRNMSYGVYLTTTTDAGKPVGCVSNSNTQITSSPATFSVSLNHDNYTTECIRRSGLFAFTILSEKSDPSLIGRFGFASSRDTDKFAGLDWDRVEWVPVVKAGCGYVVCRVIGEMETSTHTIFLGEAIAAEKLSDEIPMTYRYYHEVIRGTSPKNAPTFIAEEPKAEEKPAQGRWVCGVCGYVHEGDELPADFTCPICRQGADVFKKEA
ncbi:MAG: flavin reductase [Clostridia bacterium]|nr:flavin reductase [Clostridia bacterium]